MRTQFRLKQLVNKPTRGEWTLDLVLTNLLYLYDKNSVQTLSPFGLSDHNVVILRPKTRPGREGSLRKQMSRRDTCASRKLERGRYFCGIGWAPVERRQGCASKIQLFADVVETGLDIIMPVKKSKIHARDVSLFHYYRNAVNRERKARHGKFYTSKVNQLKHPKLSQWWNSVK